MTELISYGLILFVVFFAPGAIVVLGLSHLSIKFRFIEIVTVSIFGNIFFVYLIFLFDFEGLGILSVYATVLIVLAPLVFLFRKNVGSISFSLMPAFLIVTLGCRVLPDLGLPIMAWDGIQVWQVMADQMLVGEARNGTGTYPHGLGALGAIAMVVSDSFGGQFALRALTVFMPVLTLSIILSGSRGFKQFLSSFVAIIVLWGLLNGMDKISFKYSTSFTSDFFLFFATVLAFLANIKFAEDYNARPRWSWDVVISPAYIVAVLAIFVAANSKQTGLSYIIMPGLIALMFAPRHQPWLQRLTIAAGLTIPPALAGGVWYLFAFIRDVGASGGAGLEFLLVGVHAGRDLIERAHRALSQMGGLLPVWIWVGLIGLAIVGTMSRRGLLTLITITPTFLFYLFVSGYAVRNATGLVAGVFVLALIGVFKISEVFESRSDWILHNKLLVKIYSAQRRVFNQTANLKSFAAAASIVLLLLGTVNGNTLKDYFEAQNRRGAVEIGFRGINTRLIRNSPAATDHSVRLLTNYLVVERIPQLSHFDYVGIDASRNTVLRHLNNQTDPFVLFLLWPDRTSSEFQNFLMCLLQQEGTEDLGTLWGGRGTQFVHILAEPTDAQSCN